MLFKEKSEVIESDGAAVCDRVVREGPSEDEGWSRDLRSKTVEAGF